MWHAQGVWHTEEVVEEGAELEYSHLVCIVVENEVSFLPTSLKTFDL